MRKASRLLAGLAFIAGLAAMLLWIDTSPTASAQKAPARQALPTTKVDEEFNEQSKPRSQASDDRVRNPGSQAEIGPPGTVSVKLVVPSLSEAGVASTVERLMESMPGVYDSQSDLLELSVQVIYYPEQLEMPPEGNRNNTKHAAITFREKLLNAGFTVSGRDLDMTDGWNDATNRPEEP